MGVELKNRVNLTSERRRSSADSPAFRAVEHDRAGRNRQAVAVGVNAVDQLHRQAHAVGLGQFHVDHRCARHAGFRPHRIDHRHAVAGDDVGNRNRSRPEGRQVDAEPAGKRRVDILDAPVPVCREETDRRLVEIVDRLLQFEECLLLVVTLFRDVGQPPHPQRLAIARHRQKPRRGAVPARPLVSGAQSGRQAEFLVRLHAANDVVGKAVDGIRRIVMARQHGFRRQQILGAGNAGHLAIGLVGIDDGALLIEDADTVGHLVDEAAADVLGAPGLGEFHEADGRGEQVEHAHHRQQAEHDQKKGFVRVSPGRRKGTRQLRARRRPGSITGQPRSDDFDCDQAPCTHLPSQTSRLSPRIPCSPHRGIRLV
jgi:hypothetical protein